MSQIVLEKPSSNVYLASVAKQTDYYPFEMIMDRRSTSTAGYRYGYNGKENDDDVKGEGNQQDYGFRIYDPRVARFLSVDPLAPDYPSWSPYPLTMNRVIDGIDLDGTEYYDADEAMLENRNGKVRLKLDSFSGPVRQFYYSVLNWSPNSVGRDPTVASLNLIAPVEQPTVPPYSATINGLSTLDIVRPLRKDGMPDKRYAASKKPPGPSATLSGRATKARTALGIVTELVGALPGIALRYDKSALEEQANEGLLFAIMDVLTAHDYGMIFPNLRNNTGLGDLVNIVYSDEISSSESPSHDLVRSVGSDIINKISKVGPVYGESLSKAINSRSAFPNADAARVE